MNQNNNNEKIMLKLILEQLNENIENKHELLKQEINNIADKIIYQLNNEYVSKEDCKNNMKNINKSESIQLKSEEISYKKLVTITTLISSALSSLITFLSQKL